MDHKREHRTPPLARVMGVGSQQQHLMVDGETYECVKSFCYQGDTLDGDGGADLAATARIRNGWMKFRELLPFLTIILAITFTRMTPNSTFDLSVRIPWNH